MLSSITITAAMKRDGPLSLKSCATAAMLIFCVLAGALVCRGQEESLKRLNASLAPAASALSRNPEGLSFTIRFKDNKTQFRQGEIVRIEMAFASSLPRTYILNAASYDRSGRLEIDDYHVTPEDGIVDPLKDYSESGLFGFMGGGLYTTPELESKPYRITAELNEWVRFDKPGKYRLSVTTDRVSKLKPDGSRAFNSPSLAVVSNTIEFEIIAPDKAWSKQKLTEAITRLNATDKSEEQRAACRTLRFMNSVASAREMMRRFRGTDAGCDSEYSFGLIASPHRALVVKEMESLMAAPEHPVSGSFLHTLSLLRYLLEHPEPPPSYPQGDAEKRKLWQDEMQARRAAYEQLLTGYLEQLGSVVSRKQKGALAISLNTLFEYRRDATQGRDASRSDEQLSSALLNVFADLPGDKQYAILNYRWKQIGNQAWLPLLRRIYEKPPPRDSDTREMRDIALRRIYELAPDEARSIIIKEIRSGRPRVSAAALEILPEKTLPELDETLAAQLEHLNADDEYDTLGSYATLVERYATDAIFPRVKAAFENRIGKLACAVQTPLLAYFLRVDIAFGLEALKQALAARKDTGCYRSELANVAQLYWHPEMEQLALAHLDDRNAEVIAQAATVLGEHGSAASEQFLWDAMERWHERYNGRESQLRADMKKNDALVDPSMVESYLLRAVGAARAWLTDAQGLKKLRELCVTEQGQQQAAQMLDQWGTNIVITFSLEDDGVESASIAQYQLPTLAALKDKLAQFPRGTTFTWNPIYGEGKAGARVFTELQAYLNEHGMKLESPDSVK
jgi:hypothetical protein